MYYTHRRRLFPDAVIECLSLGDLWREVYLTFNPERWKKNPKQTRKRPQEILHGSGEDLVRLWLAAERERTNSCGWEREALGDRCLWLLTHFPMSDLNSLVRWESLQPEPFLESPTSINAIPLANFGTSSLGDRTQEGPAKQHTESAGRRVWAKATLRKRQLWSPFWSTLLLFEATSGWVMLWIAYWVNARRFPR